jgi:hypothetical protein
MNRIRPKDNKIVPVHYCEHLHLIYLLHRICVTFAFLCANINKGPLPETLPFRGGGIACPI